MADIDLQTGKTIELNKDIIKQNLIHFVLTNTGESLYGTNPGASLQSLLFENIDFDSLDEIGDRVRTTIEEEFSNIIVIDEILVQPNENNLNISIKYTIIGQFEDETDGVIITI